LIHVQKVLQMVLLLEIKKALLMVDQKVSQMGTLLLLMKMSLFAGQKVRQLGTWWAI